MAFCLQISNEECLFFMPSFVYFVLKSLAYQPHSMTRDYSRLDFCAREHAFLVLSCLYLVIAKGWIPLYAEYSKNLQDLHEAETGWSWIQLSPNECCTSSGEGKESTDGGDKSQADKSTATRFVPCNIFFFSFAIFSAASVAFLTPSVFVISLITLARLVKKKSTLTTSFNLVSRGMAYRFFGLLLLTASCWSSIATLFWNARAYYLRNLKWKNIGRAYETLTDDNKRLEWLEACEAANNLTFIRRYYALLLGISFFSIIATRRIMSAICPKTLRGRRTNQLHDQDSPAKVPKKFLIIFAGDRTLQFCIVAIIVLSVYLAVLRQILGAATTYNPYKILGVTAQSEFKEIQRAIRKLSREHYYPD